MVTKEICKTMRRVGQRERERGREREREGAPEATDGQSSVRSDSGCPLYTITLQKVVS